MSRVNSILSALWPGRGSFSRDVGQTFIGNVLIAGLNVGSGILLARHLGPEGRGELAAIQALPMIIATFGMLGLQDATIYFGARDRERVGAYAVSATSLILLLGLPIVALSYLLLPFYLAQHSDAIVMASRGYLGLFFVHAIYGLCVPTLRALHDIRLWNRVRVIPAIFWLLTIGVLVAVGLLTPTRVALIYVFIFLVLSLLALIPVRRHLRGSWRPDTALWKPLLKYGLPLAAAGAPQVLNQRLDQLIIAGMLPAKSLGYYAVAYSWAGLMQLIGAALFSVAYSKVAGMAARADQRRFITKSTWATVAASAASGLVLAWSAPLLIPWIFKSEFRAAVPVAMILVVGAGFKNVAQMLQAALMGVGKPGGVMISEWTGLGAMLVGVLVLLPRYGLVGVAWSVALSSVLTAVLSLWFVRRWAVSTEA